MTPKRHINGENKESGESVSVSELQPATSVFTGITPRDKLDIFIDSYSSSISLLPSSTILHLQYLQIKIIKKNTLKFL
ncbi:hypothetical protein E2C01_010667 [Portunus trituberculatus]|uniref:Uncharacterized protein n=1 Tax=Portunus trituberculatus TaxID=210409 RepID=A0A5B7D926_PORTR|nr:hypothetical protein [Portunus trituberculatus]